MDLSFFPLTLEAIDTAQAESICLFVASDERPLTGLAGLADWRLSGRLSRLLRGGVLTGGAGEAVLTPPGSRLGFQKLFIFGLGPLSQPEETLAERLGDSLRKLAQAGAHEVAIELPSRLPVDIGIRLLVDELNGPGRALVFGPDPQKLVAALAHAASRGPAPQLERRVVKVQSPQKPVAPPARHHVPRTQTPPVVPRAAPPSFAPTKNLPAPEFTPPPPAPIPKASALPFAPSEPPVAQPASEPPVVSEPPVPARPPESSAPPVPARPPESSAPPAAAEAMPAEAKPAPAEPKPEAEKKPAPAEPKPDLKPAPPPAQRYVPPAAKEDHVFKSKKKRRK